MGNQYGPYVMYFLSQLLQKRQAMESLEMAKEEKTHEDGTNNLSEYETNDFFENDETKSLWHKETNLELLKKFCGEGVALATKHGHFIVGQSQGRSYIGIPGRFLIEDQPAGGKTGFTLWQPLKGGNAFYDDLESISDEVAQNLYGYWIAEINSATLELSEP